MGLRFFLFFIIAVIPFKPEKAENRQMKILDGYSIFKKDHWVDSVLNTMTLDEKIGQLFMVAAYSNKDEAHKASIEKLVTEQNIGGLIFFQGTPSKQAQLTNYYQSKAKIPLLIAMDAEWGLAMRLDSTIEFPRQMTLGAIKNETLIYKMGNEIARECKRLGVQINFAPVADINNNPLNPVIHTRSFGENRENVYSKARAYMRGMQDEHVLAVAKHFPGHGDTDKDSHKSLPVIPHNRERLDSVELYPFKHLIEDGVGGIMAAHLYVPALEKEPNLPSSLSKEVIQNLLKKKMGFKGLVFTDALNMKGVTNFYKPGEVDLKALSAGNDVLLFPEDVPKAVQLIKTAIENNTIPEATLNEKVRKILSVKKWTGLDKYQPVKIKGLTKDLNNRSARLLKRKLAIASFTLVKDDENLVPVSKIKDQRFAALSIGGKDEDPFVNTLKLYASVDPYHIQGGEDIEQLKDQLSKYDEVFIGLHDISRYNTRTFDLNPDQVTFINELSQKTKVVLASFGTPYALRFFDKPAAVLQANEDDSLFSSLAAQAIFGGIQINGTLPVNVDEIYSIGSGIPTGEPIRLQYSSFPEEAGINPNHLRKIDSIIKFGMRIKAYPGCQVLVAKDNTVIYYKGWGYQTYDDKKPIDLFDLYDLASITKVAATTLAIMRFYDIGLLDVDDPLKKYFPTIDPKKANLKIKEIMTHQSGLQAWIPFYKYTLNPQGFCDSNYCYDPNHYFSVRVADHLYINNDYQDSIWNIIEHSKITDRGEYRYSDLGFFYMKRVVDSLIRTDFSTFLQTNFYEPMGMNYTTYLPLQKFSLENIVPTERDNYFRHQLIHGYVHDPAAAMMGGVAGHAGLFANANDLAKLSQMLLNHGEYGGERYFSYHVIDKFTAKQYPNNRKGLGFDKPETDPHKISPASELTSPQAFGHTGFTGTAFWADPKYNLIYVFLSNRVYPTAANNKIVEYNIRTEIQRVIYESIEKENMK